MSCLIVKFYIVTPVSYVSSDRGIIFYVLKTRILYLASHIHISVSVTFTSESFSLITCSLSDNLLLFPQCLFKGKIIDFLLGHTVFSRYHFVALGYVLVLVFEISMKKQANEFCNPVL